MSERPADAEAKHKALEALSATEYCCHPRKERQLSERASDAGRQYVRGRDFSEKEAGLLPSVVRAASGVLSKQIFNLVDS
jgi:hypothetical protein